MYTIVWTNVLNLGKLIFPKAITHSLPVIFSIKNDNTGKNPVYTYTNQQTLEVRTDRHPPIPQGYELEANNYLEICTL